MFDDKGNVVGIIVSQLNKEIFDSENVNYAVKSSILKNIIDMTVSIPQKRIKIKYVKCLN